MRSDQRAQRGAPRAGRSRWRERLVGEVGERWAAPERERFAQQRRRALGVTRSLRPSPFLEPLPEAVDVELTRLDTERISSRLRLQTVCRPARGAAARRSSGGSSPPSAAAARPKARRSACRSRATRSAWIEQKREQRPLLAAAERDLSSIVADLERTEDAEIHLPRS